ncbi:MAG: hypothetical protein SV062_02285 [Thermodesulfobacteriota bacterium]|nr:hypothetical protein [Thermodesulfobacteriota bacterium]
MKRKEISETNLNGLIQRIKQEGIEKAEKESGEIIKRAEKRASEIIGVAKKEADLIIVRAEEEIKKKEDMGKKRLEMAVRDVIISVRNSLVHIFGSLIKEDCQKVFSGKTLKTILLKVIDGWQKDTDRDTTFEVRLSETDRNVLSSIFLSRLKDKIKSGIEVKTHPEIKAGFYIGEKDGHFYYDFSDECIADVLAQFLNQDMVGVIDSIKREEK